MNIKLLVITLHDDDYQQSFNINLLVITSHEIINSQLT